jgi:hypothetical protein
LKTKAFIIILLILTPAEADLLPEMVQVSESWLEPLWIQDGEVMCSVDLEVYAMVANGMEYNLATAVRIYNEWERRNG